MPRSPQWFHQLASTIEQLKTFPAPVVDRASLENMFQISRRSAIRLLHECGGYQVGRTFLISRVDLIAALERVQSGAAFSHEVRRRMRLEEDLERTRRDWRSRQVKLPVAAEPGRAASLPAGLRIVRAGVLEVEFGSGGELLGRLYELVRIAGEDLVQFEGLLAGKS
jgi:hypothetical protein